MINNSIFHFDNFRLLCKNTRPVSAWCITPKHGDVSTGTHGTAEKTNSSIHIYPNPAQNELHIAMSNMANNDLIIIEITNMTGAVVQKMTWQQAEKIDISTLQNGMYLCHVFKNNVLMTTQKVALLK
jgi:hypothetical protein